MSVKNSIADSQKSNKKDYMRLLGKIRNYFRHQLLTGNDIEESLSFIDEDQDVEIVEDNQEMKDYVKDFRRKVEELLSNRSRRSMKNPRPIKPIDFQDSKKHFLRILSLL